tara:strand:- start:464 stop:736 length:273 start_codon:yes stop_codon:yes gene_type:complete
MTDSSSREVVADMASELIAAKIETAKKDTQMTHILKIGTFHMELVPDKNIDVKEIFGDTLDKLMDKFGDKILEITIQQVKSDSQTDKHYG